MTRYGLIGKLTATPGTRDTLAGILLEAATLLGDAPGCDQWTVHAAADDPDTLWVTEVWRNKETHDASLARPDVRALIARAMPLLARPPEGQETRPLGGVGHPTS